MFTPSPGLLNSIASFLEKSRDYLDLECPIRLAWPRRAVTVRGYLARPLKDTGSSPWRASSL